MRILLLACLGVLVGACSPTHNWRELRSAGDPNVAFVLPCRPSELSRPVQLAGATPTMTLQACSAGGVTWALAAVDMVDPQAVTPALQALRAAALSNLGTDAAEVLAHSVPGATPNPASVRLALRGRLPDGQEVEEQLALFVRGTRIFQATCLGPRLPAEAVESFFAGLMVKR